MRYGHETGNGRRTDDEPKLATMAYLAVGGPAIKYVVLACGMEDGTKKAYDDGQTAVGFNQ